MTNATWSRCSSFFAQAMMVHADFGALPAGFQPEPFPPPGGPGPAQFVGLGLWECATFRVGDVGVESPRLVFLTIPVVPPAGYRNHSIQRYALAWAFSPHPAVGDLLASWGIGQRADVSVQRVVEQERVRSWTVSVAANGSSYGFGVEQVRADVMNRSFSGDVSRRIGFDGGFAKGIVDQSVDHGPTRGDLGETNRWDVSTGPGPFAVRPRWVGAGPVGFSTPFDATWQRGNVSAATAVD